MIPPKLFISYSWSSPDHEQFVLKLARELRESGIDVILDKWDLKEGHDAYSFMEQMVTNPDIKKVVIITDRVYAEKADDRRGGVGTETQIISKEVYEQVHQDKFVAVVTEKDENGRPYVPTYYRSRIYIDLSELDIYAVNCDKLVRWVFNKPLYIKPEIGKPPPYITDDQLIQLGTSASYRRVISAIKESKSNASGALNDYLSIFAENLEKFRITEKEGEFDELIVKNIEDFIPYRNEFIQLLITISNYSKDEDTIHYMHRFFEKLISYMYNPQGAESYREWDFDNFRFIIHELFLYTIAVFLKYERFSYALHLLSQVYYVPRHMDFHDSDITTYTEFRHHLRSLDHRNERLKLRRYSIHADLLKQRSNSTGIDFRYLMQADFVLFIRTEVEGDGGWWPETLVYLESVGGTFEIFSRSVSKAYFDKVKKLILFESPQDLDHLLERYNKNNRQLPRWGFHTLDLHRWLGYEGLATKL